MPHSIISLRNVAKQYQTGKMRVSALTDISFEINSGEMIALVGPSGSGKSTLLNLMGTLDAPDSGEIEIEGQKLTDMSPDQRTQLRSRRIGFVFQNYNLIPVLTAFENIELAISNRKLPKSERDGEITRIMKAVGIDGKAKNRPQELSGGEQQRVAIARALINRPSIILADEPTASLDSKTAIEVVKTLVEMNKTFGVTLLYATHDSNIIKFSKRIIEMSDGKIMSDRENLP